MKLLILAALLIVAAATRIDRSNVRPIQEKFLLAPNKYPIHAALARTQSRSTRIVGGEEAAEGQFPYTGGLFIDTNLGQFFCACSILDTRHVLTAAHCVDDVRNGAETVLGAYNIRFDEDEQQIFFVFSNNVIVHEQWEPAIAWNDIALLRLTGTIQYTPRVQAIAIATPEQDQEFFEGAFAVTTGWGSTSDTSTGIVSYLRWVVNEVIRNAVCRGFFGSTVRAEHICVDSTGGRGACIGDSGAPLVYNGTHIGLMSFGSSSGCELGVPNVYARISRYHPWIQGKVENVN